MIFLHLVPYFAPIDGNLATIFDYASYYRDIGKKSFVYLYFMNDEKRSMDLVNIFLKRYINPISFKTVKPNSLKILICQDKEIFLSDKTFFELNKSKDGYFVLNNMKLYIYRTWFSTKEKYTFPENATVLNEQTLFGKTNFKRKIYFHNLRNEPCSKNIAFILANTERRLTREEIEDIEGQYSEYRIRICTEKENWFNSNKIEWIDTVCSNPFYYKTYIYTHNNFDNAPRMLLESLYFNKEIIIYKKPSNFDSERFDVLKDISLLKEYSLKI